MLATANDLLLGNPDQPTYLLQLEARSTRDFSWSRPAGTVRKNLVLHCRVIDLPTRIPFADRKDACASETQHAGNAIDAYAPFAHEQDIDCGFLPAPTRTTRCW